MTPLANTQTEPDDADLFAVMATQARDPDAARIAWKQLCERHEEYLWRCVRNSFGWRFHYNEHDLSDIVLGALVQAYKWAGTHSSVDAARDRFRSELPDGSLKRFRAWLGATAQNVAHDMLRKSPPSMVDIDAFNDVLAAQPTASDEHSPTPITLCVRKALALLSPRDQTVLRACLGWYSVERERFELPPGEATRIATELGMSPDAMRKSRHRALAVIRACLEADGFGEGNSGVDS